MKKTTILGATLAAFLAGCATEPSPRDLASVPDALKPAAGERLALVVPAKGAQIYECRPGKTEGHAGAWAFIAPDAELFDADGKTIGTHYAGPHWEAADGSKVVASVKARADSPLPGAIPWLLLDAKSVGKDGGLFSRVTSIQRLATAGGVAPTGPCLVGVKVRVPYSADYYFFIAR